MQKKIGDMGGAIHIVDTDLTVEFAEPLLDKPMYQEFYHRLIFFLVF